MHQRPHAEGRRHACKRAGRALPRGRRRRVPGRDEPALPGRGQLHRVDAEAAVAQAADPRRAARDADADDAAAVRDQAWGRAGQAPADPEPVLSM